MNLYYDAWIHEHHSISDELESELDCTTSLFYVPTVNAHFLKANHFLTITPMNFGISLRILHGVLDHCL